MGEGEGTGVGARVGGDRGVENIFKIEEALALRPARSFHTQCIVYKIHRKVQQLDI